ncbi:hypothetical protein GcC1_049034, partial [Golovinomyces cichoracearum]
HGDDLVGYIVKGIQYARYGFPIDKKTTIAKSLYDVFTEEDPTEWTIEEITSSNETFSSNRITNLINLRTRQQIVAPKLIQKPQDSVKYSPSENISEIKSKQDTESVINPAFQNTHDNPYKSKKIFRKGKDLSDLARIYDPEMKYSGSKDSFDYKLTIFMDLC